MSRSEIPCSQMYGMYFMKETLVSWRTDLTFFCQKYAILIQTVIRSQTRQFLFVFKSCASWLPSYKC